MFQLVWMPTAQATYVDLRLRAAARQANRKQKSKAKSSVDEGLFKQVHKTLLLLAENPKHPGLRTHEFHSLPHPYDPQGKVWEAYVQNRTSGAYRVFWCYGPERAELTIIAITPHP
jgi:hypothetical protein